jgi:hypothetical protein
MEYFIVTNTIHTFTHLFFGIKTEQRFMKKIRIDNKFTGDSLILLVHATTAYEAGVYIHQNVLQSVVVETTA